MLVLNLDNPAVVDAQKCILICIQCNGKVFSVDYALGGSVSVMVVMSNTKGRSSGAVSCHVTYHTKK